MSPRVHKCSHNTLYKGRPYGKCRKIKDNYLTAGGDSYRYVRGGFQLEEHRIGGHVQGASVAAHPMSRICGGVDIQVHEGPSQTVAWDRAGN